MSLKCWQMQGDYALCGQLKGNEVSLKTLVEMSKKTPYPRTPRYFAAMLLAGEEGKISFEDRLSTQ